MRGRLCAVLALALCLCLAGCGSVRKPLPADPVIYTQGEYQAEGEDPVYGLMTKDSKVFVPYGTIRPAGPMRDLSYAYGDCLGYVEGDENDRIYALSDDPTGGEWIIRYYVNGIMEQPMAYRELNAAGDVPESVEPFEEAEE